MARIRAEALAESLYVALSVLVRRLRQTRDDAVSVPEIAALLRLESGGPNTLTALAKEERISAQSLGATLSALESRSLVARRADPEDGRQSVVSITETGRSTLRSRRSGRAAQLAKALAGNFTPEELQALRDAAPLLERLASAL
ncbi:MAG TPA: MarR family transcriptional regulator [Candidatus Cybelea sp.]|jgi:DNA-binding MarR family transcriptional regulator|nr:MarR family transcriptional regulator [Candidatus Cybelea sp.]